MHDHFERLCRRAIEVNKFMRVTKVNPIFPKFDKIKINASDYNDKL